MNSFIATDAIAFVYKKAYDFYAGFRTTLHFGTFNYCLCL